MACKKNKLKLRALKKCQPILNPPTSQRRLFAHAIDPLAPTNRKPVVKVFTNTFNCGKCCPLSQQEQKKHERHSHKDKKYTRQVRESVERSARLALNNVVQIRRGLALTIGICAIESETRSSLALALPRAPEASPTCTCDQRSVNECSQLSREVARLR